MQIVKIEPEGKYILVVPQGMDGQADDLLEAIDAFKKDAGGHGILFILNAGVAIVSADQLIGWLPFARLRTCPTYDYWYDLRTDLRRPQSLLDLVNMILRRIRLILVKNVDPDTGETISWRLRRWVDLLDEIHVQGNCNVCKDGENE